MNQALLAFSASENVVSTLSLSPPLKWAGGKRWLVPHLKPIWERYKNRRLVEPFCGALSISLGLQPDRVLANDINPHLINFYRQLQKGLKITIEVANDENLFYQHRARFNKLIKNAEGNTPEAAQLFYFLNRTCFNGLCRFNRSGGFNVPFGKYATINYAEDFYRYREALEDCDFQNEDFESLRIEHNDFIYADPPYDVDFTSYSAGGFTWSDQLRTVEWLAKQGCPVLASNQATPRIVKLYEQYGFTIEYIDAPRRINCTGDRTAAQEILAAKGF